MRRSLAMFWARKRVLVVLGLVLVGGCGEGSDDDEDRVATQPETSTDLEDAAPTVPPAGSLSLGLDGFGAQSLNLTTTQVSHFATASITVGIVNVAVAALLVTPSASIAAALAQTPEFQSPGNWLWTYNVSPFTFNLAGSVQSASQVQWTMRGTRSPVDGNGCCEDFVWLTGTNDAGENDTQTGSWVIFDPTVPEESTQLLTVDWTYTAENDRSLLVTASQDFGNNFSSGGTVNYVVSGDTITMTVDSDPDTAGNTVISWNSTTLAGSQVNEAGETSCWDESLVNTTCP